MNLNHAGQQRELYCTLILPYVSSLEIQGHIDYSFCTTRVWVEYKVRNSWLEESDLETLIYKIKMVLNFWREQKQRPVGVHIVCRKANKQNELTSISLNLPRKKFHSSPHYYCKNVHSATDILFREVYCHILVSLKSTHRKELHGFILD